MECNKIVDHVGLFESVQQKARVKLVNRRSVEEAKKVGCKSDCKGLTKLKAVSCQFQIV